MHDEDTLTAYHEAGHAVVGYFLGGDIEQIQLSGFEEDTLPRRFGECRVRWMAVAGSKTEGQDWQRQREILTILAGPVAEMIYRGEAIHPALDGPSQGDWAQAWELGRAILPDPPRRTQFLEQLTATLYQAISQDSWWAAIAAVSDELLAHELLDKQQAEETLAFWVERIGRA